MNVKGEVLISLPLFIMKKFGKKEYERWLNSLAPAARKVFSSPLNKTEWYPLKETLVKPTNKLCELFYKNNMRGAFECGRFSAEYGLKGIYKVLVKLSSPQILINRAGKILHNYYEPSEIDVFAETKNSVVVRITKFSEMTSCIEQRIAGWMQRAVEITGSNHVEVKITQSLTRDHPFTEFHVIWKTV
ncbi:hypothetical protein ACFL6I_17385 [candidate division KSB1 bacterium]